MSHAANLRLRQQASVVPQKRRKLSENGTRPKVNGIAPMLNGDAAHKIDAVSVKDAKPSQNTLSNHGPVKIGQVDGDIDMTQLPNGAVETFDDDEESESSEKEEDDDEDDDEEISAGDEHEDDAENGVSNSELSGDEDGPVENPRHGKEALARSKHVKVDDDNSPSDQDDEGEPSFGDLLRSRGDEAIDIPALMPDSEEVAAAQSAALSSRPSLPTPTANSLGTVLTQALRSNDIPLLESCLQVSQLTSIRATIERLPSLHAATLLQRLAERMHKRPGRAGSLMVWVQWTVVAHGGYLATQPAAMKQLRELYKVVKMRATGLQPLLALKGKLDMLEAQMQLRRNRRITDQRLNGDEEAVIYVEGEEQSDSEMDDEGGVTRITNKSPMKKKKKKKEKPLELPFPEESGDDDDDMPNGINGSEADDIDADDDAEMSDEDDEDLIDDEAEETDNDSDEEISDDDINFDDVDGGDSDDDEDDDDAPPPPKRSKGSSRR